MRRNTKGNGFAGAVVMTVLTVGVMSLFIWAVVNGYFEVTFLFGEPPGFLITGMALLMVLMCVSVAVGTIKALYQRWREIEKGELDEARKY